MISRIEALRFRCLKRIRQELDDFHVLVGPNASGKTTFLDVVAFMGDLVSEGIDQAVHSRVSNFQDLLWMRTGLSFELALELAIPETIASQLPKPYPVVRYEVAIGLDQETDEFLIQEERVLLLTTAAQERRPRQMPLFPGVITNVDSILYPPRSRKAKTIVKKVAGGNDNFYAETGKKSWSHSFKLGPRKSSVGNLPQDESRFPVTTWLRAFLIEGVQRLNLNSLLMRNPSPPGRPKGFLPDGSNLPWVVEDLREKAPERFDEWVRHIGSALPEISGLRTVVRPEDRHRYLVVRYANNLEAPSWLLSDGTLRLLALTLPAYLPDLQGVFLIEEPENGIHPRAVETVFQSLSTVYDAQVLLATHSPVVLSAAEPNQVLCFAKSDEGATDIVRGSKHPALRDWKGSPNFSVLFAGGVLG